MPDEITLPTPPEGAFGVPTPNKRRDLLDVNSYPPNSTKLFKPPDDNTVAPAIYVEHVQSRAPYTDNVSMDNSVFQLVVKIPWELRSQCISRYMGYQYVEGTKLKRVLPLAHPFFEFARCRRVLNIQGIGPRGTAPREPGNLGDDIPEDQFPRPHYAEYDYALITLQFETMPFDFKTDSQITEESERNVFRRIEPGYDSLYIEGGTGDKGTFKFDTAYKILDNVTPDNPSPDGKVSFHNGRTVPLQVAKLVWTWYDVPWEFVTNSTGKPTNIMNCVGKVNDATFWGFPAYTLLCDVPQIDLRPNPIPPFISTNASFLANIQFTFHYFEPTNLGTYQTVPGGPALTVPQRGHNMAIWRFTRKWYPCSIDGDGAEQVYKTYDFRKLFRKAEAN